MFLQILGVIFLVVLVVVAFYGWKIYRFVKRQAKTDTVVAMSVLPAQDMELEPAVVDEWKEKERLGFMEAELKKIGAGHTGYFCVYMGSAIVKLSIWNIKGQAMAVIYEAASEQDENTVMFFYEVACKLASGSVCVTSNPHAEYDSRPAGHIISYVQSDSILGLVKALKANIPVGGKLQKINDPKEFFLECYEDISEWGWRAEQLTSEKTQQTLAAVGVDVNDELMSDLIEYGKKYSIEVHVNKARRRFAERSGLSASQWEKIRDKLVYINEKMGVDELISGVYDLAGELTEAQELIIEGFEHNNKELVDPISAFQLLLQSLNIKAKRLASMEKPIKTGVYMPL
ncbi:hypothetical protein KO528_17065 [Saccharophagus degradans]|uniref:Uncharacterized protein n=1 Tax=Saccharophagus degradans TaxID=86304 RepID=A0AAW7XA43_9GAMM|nr:hypothetical protein [Saccharophagus degradans]MBU2987080.1 hypothetical protein [Saccharophagus degradans]MDO6423781.1 hypothetical protein [Saccharophagus degradans]MDO6607861.1 hypothetical protein [Saccharophagus degradans]